MRFEILAAGSQQPAWVSAGFEEYRKRLPRECRLALTEIRLGARRKPGDVERAVAGEGKRMLAALRDAAHVVALDVAGRTFSTAALAREFENWLAAGRDVAFLIGGPDGLAPDCLARAQLKWSLSALTLPHGLVRVIVAEQLYRAWTILHGHPYHRG
ncbi:MAG: 23S rRNA (pseudouridine(1915)-N(3))-methyltransferase RlmH [Gammaproteobacteria bacterium]